MITATDLTDVITPGDVFFRKYTDSKPLRELEDQVVQLTVRFSGIGHITVCGRVRIVHATPAVWIDQACLPFDVEVYEDRYDSDAYICEVRGR